MKLVSYLHITIVLSLVALISSCTDEDIVKSYNIKEGVPVTVSLKYNVAQSTVETRSAQDATVEGHGYGKTGGVSGAVQAKLGKEVSTLLLSNLNKKNIGLLRAYAKSGKCPNQFIEVMACEGGCVTGPCTHIDKATAQKVYVKELANMVAARAKK